MQYTEEEQAWREVSTVHHEASKLTDVLVHQGISSLHIAAGLMQLAARHLLQVAKSRRAARAMYYQLARNSYKVGLSIHEAHPGDEEEQVDTLWN